MDLSNFYRLCEQKHGPLLLRAIFKIVVWYIASVFERQRSFLCLEQRAGLFAIQCNKDDVFVWQKAGRFALYQ